MLNIRTLGRNRPAPSSTGCKLLETSEWCENLARWKVATRADGGQGKKTLPGCGFRKTCSWKQQEKIGAGRNDFHLVDHRTRKERNRGSMRRPRDLDPEKIQGPGFAPTQ